MPFCLYKLIVANRELPIARNVDRVPSLLLQRNGRSGLVSSTKNVIIISSVVVTEKYCIDQLPMIPLIDYTMIVGVVKTVGVVKCPDIHFQKLGNYATWQHWKTDVKEQVYVIYLK